MIKALGALQAPPKVTQEVPKVTPEVPKVTQDEMLSVLDKLVQCSLQQVEVNLKQADLNSLILKTLEHILDRLTSLDSQLFDLNMKLPGRFTSAGFEEIEYPGLPTPEIEEIDPSGDSDIPF